MVKSPLRYPGGKSRVIKKIAPLLPPYKEYREAFVGGASLFLHQKQSFPTRQFWINDLYTELYHFWNNCQQDLSQVVAQVELWKTTFRDDGRALHRFLIQQLPSFPPLQKASAFFVLNRITFSGTIESGGFSEQAFQKRFTPSSIERLKAIGNILENTRITNLDYQEVVEEKGENVFIFLDPPYYSASKSALYGKKGALHKFFDHERFALAMKNCPHQWLITYDNSDYIRELFDFANIIDWEITYGMRNIVGSNSKQQAKELFITNYTLKK